MDFTPGSFPLQGLRVVEVGGALAGSFCGKLLSAFGAEVVKVEPPAGDAVRRLGPFAGDRYGIEDSLVFLYLNTGKLGITLDFGSATGATLLRQLVKGADVIVESLPLSLEPAPEQVVTSIRDFGEGPYADYRGGELVLLALGGLLNMVGDIDREPVRLGSYQAQYSSGLAAFTGTLAALHERDTSGLGQRLEVSVMETVAFVEWKSSIYFQADGRLRTRGGHDAQWLVLACQDGFVAFVYQDEQWPAVQRLIGDPALVERRFGSRDGRLAGRAELRAIFQAWALERCKTDIYHTAQALGLPVGIVADASDVLRSPQYAATGYFDRIEHPSTGTATYPGIPCTFDGARPTSFRAPLLGEHNQHVYGGWVGLASVDLARLRERGVI